MTVEHPVYFALVAGILFGWLFGYATGWERKKNGDSWHGPVPWILLVGFLTLYAYL